jgi:hypothetical protein
MIPDFVFNCVTYDEIFPIMVGCILTGWLSGVLMYRFGVVWKATHKSE